MKRPFKLTHQASITLRKIGDETRKNFGRRQAKKYLTELDEFFHLLDKNSAMGRARTDISKNTLSMPVNSHVVYYQDDKSPIVITRIKHQREDPEYDISTPVEHKHDDIEP